MRGFTAVLRKEALQMMRDSGTLRLAILIPLFELIVFGVIDDNVKHVPTVIFDQSRTQESRQLIRDFTNSTMFDIARNVGSHEALRREIVAGRASVGIEIPPEYSRRRLRSQPADFQVLIDGSDASISAQALGAADGIALSRSVEEMQRDRRDPGMALRISPQILFNPDSRSANLLIPGLVAILLTFSGMMLSAFSIVRERERGTLEQLMVTPVSTIAVVIGKLLPYLAIGVIQTVLILAVMTGVFRVPIHGSVILLFVLAIVYLFSLLAIGLLISSRARTQMEAIQMSQSVLLPSVLLSGYVFPLSSLPIALRWVSTILPATYFIAISRGIIIRGAGLRDLWPDVAALLALSAVVVLLSNRAFKKTVT